MTYASRLRTRLDPKSTYNKSFPDVKLTAWVLERMAEEEYQKKILGGFSRKRICPGCMIALPATNYCDQCGFSPEGLR